MYLIFLKEEYFSLSTSTDNITSVSRQRYNLYRRRRRQAPRNRRQPSRASSLSSMTETSMALEVITVLIFDKLADLIRLKFEVTLNMDSTVNFLGISIVGQSSSRGDNGIYVVCCFNLITHYCFIWNISG